MKIRIKFSKHGPVKFIGHLDLLRFFQKAMRRAEVASKYSEGFSPHQIMSFASPLGVGLTGNGEYMDIEVSETDTSAVMVKRLNQVMVEGIEVLSYRLLPDHAQNAMSMVAAADYTMAVRSSHRPKNMEAFYQKFHEFLDRETIEITKKTKRGERCLDVRPMIYQARVQDDTLFLRLATGSSENLKPELVMETFYQWMNLEYPAFGWMVQREELYALAGETAADGFCSLEDYGKDIETAIGHQVEG